eukprot:CAMPEP_0113588966 /NCGR_PEP_ID=MMETSP0015_2-20120614/35821_1 /TAXON_ID=2838 /ORGANISM="Odontella" /LENGTH=161 /DNA_ID=CAMNT_0000494923 /DNA_START=163 /DNA_END=645 /DNA_ORIENTATION=- /assembly_acc=CAM_ASM_000160
MAASLGARLTAAATASFLSFAGAVIPDDQLPSMPYRPLPATKAELLEFQAQGSIIGTNGGRNVKQSCGSCCYQVEDASTYSDHLTTSFYSKAISINGFLIASSAAVSDEALYEAALTVGLLTKDRLDLLLTLVEEGVHLTVIGKDEKLTDVPEYSVLDSAW